MTKDIASTETTKEDVERERDYWRDFAAYLSQCQAATAESLPSRTGKYERKRHADICTMAAQGLAGGWTRKYSYHQRDEVEVALERCKDAALALTEQAKA